ncbi:hypothetical protein NIIDMKKI_14570 [Mycobacterium kansasii]|uniref:Uncharacterized protein n=1 Tax=Mycobacterium kansasii TaxID=1768 RepID=A0A7G1I5J4_MYCKA|nr:hypothetical protein NIIDMKKI_14570 [Mycobacterium kansasii]
MGKRQSRPPTRALEQRRPSRYPIPVTGITPDRDCGALGLAPPRPIISPGIPAPPVPLGIIGIIGIPGELGSPVSAAGVGIPAAPKPDIAELAIGAGTDPCQVGGTDMPPTIRALPKSAAIAEPSPPPPDAVISACGTVINFGTSAGNPLASAPAIPPVGVRVALLIKLMSGDIAMLSGYINNDTLDHGSESRPDSAAEAIAAMSCAGAAADETTDGTPEAACDANPANPGLDGGGLNGAIVEATDAAPA